jgi:hypothetical protein
VNRLWLRAPAIGMRGDGPNNSFESALDRIPQKNSSSFAEIWDSDPFSETRGPPTSG